MRTTLLPRRLLDAVQLALRAGTGGSVSGEIVSVESVTGGDIHRAHGVRTRSGDLWFLKWNAAAPAGMFAAEAEGLEALRRAAPADLHIPEVIAFDGPAEGGGEADPSWLLLEWIERGLEGGETGRRLGSGLAELHAVPPAGGEPEWGWGRDNWIGILPQSNAPSDRWVDFWRERRLAPQLRLAREKGAIGDRAARDFDRLLDRLTLALEGVEEEGSSLLHGDLWGGNVFGTADGRPALFDPAVYRGHAEVDLAMSELFGFPGGFLEAYRERRPISPAYYGVRRHVYQLYYLLVHVNLFGGGYVVSATQAARRVLSRIEG